MLRQITLPEGVHDESTYRVWQRRFYDFSVWSKRKRLEKLDHARQPGEAEVGGDPSRLALVELEVLPFGKPEHFGNGPSTLNGGRRHAHGACLRHPAESRGK